MVLKQIFASVIEIFVSRNRISFLETKFSFLDAKFSFLETKFVFTKTEFYSILLICHRQTLILCEVGKLIIKKYLEHCLVIENQGWVYQSSANRIYVLCMLFITILSEKAVSV